MPSVLARPKKAVKRGVQLTLMVAGASGNGRTTFVNTLVDEPGWLKRKDPGDTKEAAEESATHITVNKIDLDVDGKQIRLTVCDTPGFGNSINNGSSFEVISKYLDKQYESVLQQESLVKRAPQLDDGRVHALLYFITPTGHSLREVDIELMRKVASQVNVIPVIGKADSLTSSELAEFKRRIMEDIEHYQIPVYNFPFDPDEDDEDVVAENIELRAMLPFGIVCSETEVELDGQIIRGRKYPWGTVDVDDPEYSDFDRLRSALFSSHLHDLRDITSHDLYENYRTRTLTTKVNSAGEEFDPQEEERSEQMLTLKEEQLKQEEQKLRENEMRVQREIIQRKLEIQAKEELLKSLESRYL